MQKMNGLTLFDNHLKILLLVGIMLFVFGCGGSSDDEGNPQDNTDDSESENPEDSDSENTEDSDSENPEDSDSENPEDSDSENPETGEMCEPEDRVGYFQIIQADSYTNIYGMVFDSAPAAAAAEVISTNGDCTLLGPRNPFCDPGCTGGQVCTDSGECVDARLKINVGTVTLLGLKSDVEVEANNFTKEYNKKVDDPFPAWEPGDKISLKADGDDYSAIEIDALGVPTLETSMTSITVESGTATEITWEKPDNAIAGSEIHMKLTVNAHGATTGWIECVTEDSGEFEIPEPIITELVNMGLSGFPSILVSRRTTNSTELDHGCMDMAVFSEIGLDVEIPGMVSCNDNSFCEDDEYCTDELVCKPIE